MCGMVWFFFILNRTSKMLFAKKLIEEQPVRSGPRGSSKSGSKNKSQIRRSTSKFFHHAGSSHFTVISQVGMREPKLDGPESGLLNRKGGPFIPNHRVED